MPFKKIKIIALVVQILIINSINGQPGWIYSKHNLTNLNSYPYPSTIHTDDTLKIKYSIQQCAQPHYSIIGNVNQDEYLELVYAYDSIFKIFNWQGQIIHCDSNMSFAASPGLIKDINDDGRNEIILGSHEGPGLFIKVLDHSFNENYSFHKTGGGQKCSMIPLFFKNDKIISTNGAGWALSPRGWSAFDMNTETEIWSYDVGPNNSASNYADFYNNDTILFTRTSNTSHNGVSGDGWNGNGTYTTDNNMWLIIIDEYGNEFFSGQFPEPKDGTVHNVFVDFNNDGNYKILSLEAHNDFYPGNSEIHIITVPDGTIQHITSGYVNGEWAFAISDINNDGIKEIIASNFYGETKYNQIIYDHQLNKTAQAKIKGEVACVNDINGDGWEEIILFDDYTVKILDHELKFLTSMQPSNSLIKRIIVSDLDNNGINELIVFNDDIFVLEPTLFPDQFEPDNTHENATLISENHYSDTLHKLTEKDVDWYRFTYNYQPYFIKVSGLDSNTIGHYGFDFSIIDSMLTVETFETFDSINTTISLYDNQMQLLSSDDNSGINTFSKIIYTLPVYYSISGCIYISDELKETSGSVILYDVSKAEKTAIDTTAINNGDYKFPTVPQGSYKLCALPQNKSFNPTFFGDKSDYNSGYTLNVHATIGNADIRLLPYTHINNHPAISALKIYPNPVKDILHISFNANEPCMLSFHISDITGKTVISREHQITASGEQILQINTKQLENGIYTLKVVKDDIGSQYWNFVK
jgi:hypothetical protein